MTLDITTTSAPPVPGLRSWLRFRPSASWRWRSPRGVGSVYSPRCAPRADRGGAITERSASKPLASRPLLLAAVLLVAGVVVTAAAGFPPSRGCRRNDHPAPFAISAASRSWRAVHLLD